MLKRTLDLMVLLGVAAVLIAAGRSSLHVFEFRLFGELMLLCGATVALYFWRTGDSQTGHHDAPEEQGE